MPTMFLDTSKLEEVLRRRKPTKYFWCDMTDMFGDWVPDEWIAACFGVMAATPHHTHQVLTKRPERMLEWFRWAGLGALDRCACLADDMLATLPRPQRALSFAPGRGIQEWPLPNVHLGVSAEDQQRADERIPLLLQCPAAVWFVSAEPLLGPLGLARLFPSAHGKRNDKFWVIVGGESGPGARPCDVEWIRAIVRQCRDAGTRAFVKQLGSLSTCNHDRKGGCVGCWPSDIRVREFPDV